MAEVDLLIRAELERLAPAGEAAVADFRQVRRRVGGKARSGLVIVAVITAFVLAGIATATYLTLRSAASAAVNGPLMIATEVRGDLRIQTVGTDGRLRTTWSCPRRVNCGQPSDVAWSPDGKQLAIAAISIARISPYDGLDLLNIRTGTLTNLLRYGKACPPGSVDGSGYDVGWARDGKHVAFTCHAAKIQIIDVESATRRAISTGLRNVISVSWSPDGTQLAFAAGPSGHSAIYVIDANGRGRHLIARHGRAPAWSPTDALIAYRAPAHGAACGALRLVTPEGEDATPSTAASPCHQFGPQQAGAPAWSPDGTQIAVSSNRGLYVVQADGSNLRRISTAGAYLGRPAWQPRQSGPPVEYVSTPASCSVC
jgi:Tol biopolymer transport system component